MKPANMKPLEDMLNTEISAEEMAKHVDEIFWRLSLMLIEKGDDASYMAGPLYHLHVLRDALAEAGGCTIEH